MSTFAEIMDVTDILMANREAGYSVNIDWTAPTDGYMVGGEAPSLVIRSGETDYYSRVDAWLEINWATLEVSLHNYAGVWTDTETGDIFFDISRNVTDLYMALAIAEARGEIAIWDVASKKEVRVGFDG